VRSDSKRVLVTNDDGVDAPGIRALAKAALRAGCTVTVVAPDGDRSGSAAAIGPLSTTPPRRLHVEGIPELSVFAVDAPPAVVVLASHAGAFGPPPHGVLSGVNRGANVGRGVLHSGTVGAALTAANLGLPAVAVSLEPSDDPDWDAAASLAVERLQHLWSEERITACNLNVPARPASLAPVAATLAATGLVTAAADDESFSFELRVASDAGADEGSDAALLAAGAVTYTLLAPLGGAPGTDVVTARLEPTPTDAAPATSGVGEVAQPVEG
jgi:5'-nucleotidase